MSKSKDYKKLLRELKNNRIFINVDGRKSINKLTRGEKQKISKLHNKFSEVIDHYYTKKRVSKKAARILSKEYNHLAQGQNVWFPNNGSKYVKLIDMKVKTDKKGVHIRRTFDNGTVTDSYPLFDKTDFFKYAERKFKELEPGQALTVQIGGSGAWNSRAFASMEELEHYLALFYQEVAERDHWKGGAREVQRELEPLIILVDYKPKYDKFRGKHD